MRLPRTVHDIDELVARADESGDRQLFAERLRRAADRLPTGPGSLRAECLVAAAELWQLGHPGRALEVMLEAQADGGPVRLDIRAHVALARAAAGDVDQARADLAALMRDLPSSLDLHLHVGQGCAAYGLLPEALTWLTRGVLLAERAGELGLRTALLLMTRWGVRERLALPADDWDRAAERLEHELDHVAVDAAPPSPSAVITRDDQGITIDLVAV
jgi:hypothetical protein